MKTVLRFGGQSSLDKMTLNQLYKTEDIIKVSSEETLSKALSCLSSSHDSAFVFENDKFLGVINPYYCLIKKSYPANAKVNSCLIHPPKVDVNFSLKKVAQLMIDSKIHYLPVFAGQRFLGIISARRLISVIKDSSELKIPIREILKRKKPLISVYEDDFITQALSLFKQYRVSKLVVVNKDLKLKGILTYFDLIAYLSLPKERQNLGTREGGKVPLLRRYVKNFMQSKVLTLTENDNLSSAAKMILEKEIGSVVIVDSENHPIGIITTRDLLSAFINKKENLKVELVAKKLSKKSLIMVNQFVDWLNNRLKRIKKIFLAKIIVSEEKKGGVFKTTLSLFFKKGPVMVIKKEGKNLKKVLQEVKEKSK